MGSRMLKVERVKGEGGKFKLKSLKGKVLRVKSNDFYTSNFTLHNLNFTL
jgi:hypothetical protein